MKFKSDLTKSALLFFALTILIKPVWLFDNNSLSGDDLSYWLHASTLAFDYDIDYKSDYTLSVGTFNDSLNTPSHPPGTGYLSAPFVFIFSIVDNLKKIEIQRTNPIGTYAYAGYFFATQFYLILGFYYLNKLFEINKVDNHKRIIFLLTLFSTLIHYSTTRFLMSHTTEFFLTCYLIYVFEKRKEIVSLDFKKLLIVYFLMAITRPSTFIISICLLMMHRKKIFKFIKSLSNILLFCILCLAYYLLSQKLYDTNSIILNLSSNKTTENYVELINFQNFWDGFINLPKLFFSFSGGLIWLMPIIFFGVLLFLFNLKNLNYEYAFFSFLYIFGFFAVAMIWKGNEVAYGQRLFIGLLPFCAYQLGIFLNSKAKAKMLVVFIVICYLHYMFFYSSNTLTLREGYSLWGTYLKYSHENYTLNLIKQLGSLYNYLNIFSKTIYSVLFFAIFQFKNIVSFLPEYLQNIVQIDLFQIKAEKYYSLDLDYVISISLIYFLSTIKYIKILNSKKN